MKISKTRAVLFGGIVAAVSLASFTPYTNLFISFTSGVVSLYLFSVYIFRLSSVANILVGIGCFVIALPWLLIGSRVRVESLGILAFFALSAAILQELWKLRKGN